MFIISDFLYFLGYEFVSKQRQRTQTRKPTVHILTKIPNVILQATENFPDFPEIPHWQPWFPLWVPWFVGLSTPVHSFHEKMWVHTLCSPVMCLWTQRRRLQLRTGFFSSSAGCSSSRPMSSLPGASYPCSCWTGHRCLCSHPNQTEGLIRVKKNTLSPLVYLRGWNELGVQSEVWTT